MRCEFMPPWSRSGLGTVVILSLMLRWSWGDDRINPTTCSGDFQLLAYGRLYMYVGFLGKSPQRGQRWESIQTNSAELLCPADVWLSLGILLGSQRQF